MPKRKDPLEAFRAQGLPENPVGTPDELLAHKMSLRVFPSCAEPAVDESVKGCPHWYECTMSYKGLPAAEGGGPRNHCWERIKSAGNGGGIVRNTQPCFWGIPQQENVMLNKEVLRPIADEGEEFESLDTFPDTTAGRDQYGFFKWDTKLRAHTVAPFVRLGQEQKLARHELLASIIDRDQKKVREDHAAKQLGIAGTAEPIDKRGRRGSKGPEKEG